MTNKRFVTEGGCCGYYTEIIDIGKELNSSLPNPKKNLTIEELVDLLNELNDKCDFLEIENESLEEGATKYAELYHKSLKENSELKSKNKGLQSELQIFKEDTIHSNLIINKLADENEKLKELMKNLKHEYDSLHDRCLKLEKKVKCIQEEANDYCEELMGKDEFIRLYKRQRDEVIEENEQLKKRNENQYNQLIELWEIIEEENWEKLIAMKKQLKEDEERLRNEWKCYE